MRKSILCQLGPRLFKERKVKVKRHKEVGKATRYSA